MKTIKIILFLLFVINCSYSQEKKQNDTIKIEINSNTKTIYLLGGIASVITKEDLAFGKKYNIQFHDFGCVAPTNFKEYEEKNVWVFEFLNKTFGKQWQKEIKPSVLGFDKWKKK
ncbi:FEKKY domain-containing protein [Flavobacterium channae]|uniref:FEKKY domain-containing protein n=1 Tax=Flavobacterium channae TaxID=2897181 RepID=UPI001E5B6371|nr:hypothetical protein [Flavobacterium channae]UGS24659.1 hypothetical protein LOS89_05125 [Flavobacterium channae]